MRVVWCGPVSCGVVAWNIPRGHPKSLPKANTILTVMRLVRLLPRQEMSLHVFHDRIPHPYRIFATTSHQIILQLENITPRCSARHHVAPSHTILALFHHTTPHHTTPHHTTPHHTTPHHTTPHHTTPHHTTPHHTTPHHTTPHHTTPHHTTPHHTTPHHATSRHVTSRNVTSSLNAHPSCHRFHGFRRPPDYD